MLEKTWKTLDGKEIKDVIPLFKTEMVGPDKEVHVGTDSQQIGKFTEYVTVVVVINRGKGGRVFCSKEKVPRIKSLRERLMKEVWMSVNTALELNAHIPETIGLTVHVDANPNVKFKSSTYVQELSSMVMSQGFRLLLKPDAWASSHTADHVVKHKTEAR